MNKTDIALNYVHANGPVLPVQISKAINTNIILASAILAELVSLKKVKLTHQNIGSSPLYYVVGQEEKLEPRLRDKIGGRKKEALDLLKEKGVVDESELEPAIRVAIKEIKDFAIPLNVTFNNQTFNFWKWYLMSSEEVRSRINSILKPEPIHEPQAQKPLPIEEPQAPKPLPIEEPQAPEHLPMPVEEPLEPQKTEIQETIGEPEIKETKKKEVEESRDILGFYKEIDAYFKKNNIKILKEEIIKRDREFNFIIAISSNLGELKYFVKVKNKKKINDADISLAYSQAQIENLPLIYLTNGEIIKKAQKLIDNTLKGIVYKRV